MGSCVSTSKDRTRQSIKPPVHEFYHDYGVNEAKGLPSEFCWLEPAVMAGSSVPEGTRELEGLVREGVSHLVSLPAEPGGVPAGAVRGLTIHFLKIKDFEAPSMEQMDEFLHICEVAKAAVEGVAVHRPRYCELLFQVSGMRVGVVRCRPGLEGSSSVGGSQGHPGLSQPHA